MPALPDVDAEAARAVVQRSLLGEPEGGALSEGDVTQLFAAYGVQVFSAVLVDSADEAAAGAAGVGYPVALKATAEPLRHRPELGTVIPQHHR